MYGRDRAIQIVGLLTMGSLAIYCFLRIVKLPFTHDESYSWLIYVGKSFMGIISYEAPVLPNNHILNTLLMKASGGIFGPSEWALRLPNWLFFLNYCGFTWLLLRRIISGWAIIPAIILFTANPYLLDFFSLARGYGMSISLMITGAFFLYRYLEEGRKRDEWWTFIALALAVLASFTVLNVYLAAAAVYLLSYWMRNKNEGATRSFKNFMRQNLPLWVVSLVLAGILYEPFRKIQSSLFGGEDGFWVNTIDSVWFRSTYNQFPQLAFYLRLGFMVLLISGGCWMLWKWWKDKNHGDLLNNSMPWLLFLLPALSITLQFYLLNSFFVTNRTALFFFPLMILVIVFFFYKGPGIAIPAWGRNLILSLFAVFAGLNFFRTANLEIALDWDYEANSREIFQSLEIIGEAEKKVPLEVDNNWLFEPTQNYYRITIGKGIVNPLDREDWKTGSGEYLILTSGDTQEQEVEIIRIFEPSKAVLARRKP